LKTKVTSMKVKLKEKQDKIENLREENLKYSLFS